MSSLRATSAIVSRLWKHGLHESYGDVKKDEEGRPQPGCPVRRQHVEQRVVLCLQAQIVPSRVRRRRDFRVALGVGVVEGLVLLLDVAVQCFDVIVVSCLDRREFAVSEVFVSLAQGGRFRPVAADVAVGRVVPVDADLVGLPALFQLFEVL
ncbi:hypothetical protein QMK34_44910 [Amycolatopsis sp. H20-H5]|nr:hypothetical protein [Amycolatopsis sp. H20-H5]MEC3982384.1 hypothetical protein [Amycolatopsis sp. H20-H5]